MDPDNTDAWHQLETELHELQELTNYENTSNVRHTDLLVMGNHESQMSESKKSAISPLRRPWNSDLQEVAYF